MRRTANSDTHGGENEAFRLKLESCTACLMHMFQHLIPELMLSLCSKKKLNMYVTSEIRVERDELQPHLSPVGYHFFILHRDTYNI